MSKHELLEKAVALAERNQESCENMGLCLACGEEQDGCEPDARGYECESCGKNRVFGAQEVIMMLVP